MYDLLKIFVIDNGPIQVHSESDRFQRCDVEKTGSATVLANLFQCRSLAPSAQNFHASVVAMALMFLSIKNSNKSGSFSGGMFM